MSELKANVEATNYNFGEIITPFQSSGQEWDQKIGTWRNKARIWRMSALTLLCVNFFLILIFILEMLVPQHTIYAASITDKGYVKHVGILTDDYVIPAKLTEKFINQYLQSMFFKGGVAKLMSQNEQFVLDFSSDSVDEKFKNMLAKEALGDLSYPITIEKVELVSGNTFNASWRQNEVNQSTGKVVGYTTYSGQFQVNFVEPNSPEQVQQNPLGFFVEQAKWQTLNETNNGQKTEE